jgi:pyruvate, orthophosphate dikinase
VSGLNGKWVLSLDGSSLPDRAAIGGKAWSIAKMKALGLPVPPAFVVRTTASVAYMADGFPAGLTEELAEGMAWLEAQTGRQFGRGDKPLLVSVRSGAAISMPGMMDTVLNLGIDPQTEAALAAESGLPGFARDTLRRFYELYASIVLKTPVELAHDGDAAVWSAAIQAATGAPLPGDVNAQLLAAVTAVFDSWNSRRAKRYRAHNGIDDSLGTAVTIQAMVFGNLDDDSGTGVLFSRNPLTGDPAPFGEYLPRAQGEDVVSGKVTPLPLSAMKDSVPEAHDALLAASNTLEADGRDVQDIEFTVQNGTLYLLQARSAKRSPEAAVRLAVDMVDEGLIRPEEAVRRVTPEQAASLLLPRLASEANGAPVFSGEGACPGVAVGVMVSDPNEAERRAAAGEAVILVRATTSPDDVHGMIAARGIITEQGGATSHAAVVSRALGRPCIVGCGPGVVARAGETVTIDGGAGKAYAGALDVVRPDEGGEPRLARLIEWARTASPLEVRRFGEEASGDLVDLDASPAAAEVSALPQLVAGHQGARGVVLGSVEGARAAIGAGVKLLVTDPVLPALLVSLEERS